MENPAQEIKDVVRTLTQGSPDEQRDAIYRYFAPGAIFEHPFCRVPSFKNVQVPGVGNFDSRALVAAIFKWYKILSPRIDLDIESCVLDEETSTIYLRIFQVFSIWFIPFYRAPVRLVSVFHLKQAPPGSSSSDSSSDAPAPPPYDAAQEKLQAVQEGAEPSYAAVTAGEASASDQQSTEEAGSSGRRKSSDDSQPKRYLIAKQEDLYQVTEFLKFVTLTPGSMVASFMQLIATLLCLVGSVLLAPFVRAAWPSAAAVKGGNGKEKKRE